MIKIPGAKPYYKNIPEILHDIKKVLESGRLMLGSFNKELEESFARYVGTDYAIAVSSCTAALELVMRYVAVKGGEVILPANTFIACGNAILYAGGQPVFAEIEPESCCLDLADVIKKITPRTRAIITVHLAGLPMPRIRELRDLCRARKIFLIEDCSHAHGAMLDNQPVGSFGDAGCFSFIATKVITSGVGGLITTNNAELAQFARSVRHQGEGGNLDSIIHLGNDWLMSELNAVLGCHHVRQLDEILTARQRIADRYRLGIEKMSHIRPNQVPANVRHSYYKFLATVDEKVDKEQLINGMKGQGIEMGSLYMKPVYQHPVYQKMGFPAGLSPVTEKILQRQISLPVYFQMTDEEINYVLDNLSEQISNNLLL